MQTVISLFHDKCQARLHWGKAGWPEHEPCYDGSIHLPQTWCHFGCAVQVWRASFIAYISLHLLTVVCNIVTCRQMPHASGAMAYYRVRWLIDIQFPSSGACCNSVTCSFQNLVVLKLILFTGTRPYWQVCFAKQCVGLDCQQTRPKCYFQHLLWH